jgi:DNA-binding transcriptional LysR family regulator
MWESCATMPAGPRFTLDQLHALTTAAESGSLREAAARLHLSEAGLRSRLMSLEQAVGRSLYIKQQGRRGRLELTPHGLAWLDKARDLLARARVLDEDVLETSNEVRVASSQYLAYYVLIDTIRAFRTKHPKTVVRLWTRIEQDIEHTLLEDASFELAFCAPRSPDPRLGYRHWFDLEWWFVAPRKHRFAERTRLGIHELAGEPLILFESGSTGREHQLEAFRRRNLTPRVEMEASTTALIVRMVEAGLGVSVLPLLRSGTITRGANVVAVPLGHQVRPIGSGVLYRRDVPLSPVAQALMEFALGRSI